MSKKYRDDQVRFEYFEVDSQSPFDTEANKTFEKYEDAVKYSLRADFFPTHAIFKNVYYVDNEGQVLKDYVFVCKVPTQRCPETVDYRLVFVYERGTSDKVYDYTEKQAKDYLILLQDFTETPDAGKLLYFRIYKITHNYVLENGVAKMDTSEELILDKQYQNDNKTDSEEKNNKSFKK